MIVIVWHALHMIPMFSTSVHNKNLYLDGNRAGWPLHPINNKISDEPWSIYFAHHALFMMLIPREYDSQSLLLPYDEFSGRNESTYYIKLKAPMWFKPVNYSDNLEPWEYIVWRIYLCFPLINKNGTDCVSCLCIQKINTYTYLSQCPRYRLKLTQY